MEADASDQLPEFHGEQPSLLVWVFRALGIRYTLLLPLLAVFAVALAAIAIWKFKTPHLTAVLLAVVPLPLFYGVMSAIDGMLASWQVISMVDATIKGSELAEGMSLCLVGVQAGLLLSLPAYALAVMTLCYRALQHTEAIALVGDKEPSMGALLGKQVRSFE